MSFRLLVAALLAALVACPAAVGHGDGAARGYTSTVTAITPKLDGLTVQVLQGDDQLDVRNDSGRELVIEGYEGEPYLRFGADGGVFRNANSPATYLNEERYGGVDVPASASKTATPRWDTGRPRPLVRLARPPDPLDEHDRPAEGATGEGQAASRLRLERPRQRRRSAARDPGSLDYKPPPRAASTRS